MSGWRLGTLMTVAFLLVWCAVGLMIFSSARVCAKEIRRFDGVVVDARAFRSKSVGTVVTFSGGRQVWVAGEVEFRRGARCRVTEFRCVPARVECQ